MQPLSKHTPSTLAPRVNDYISQTSNNTNEAWAKGIAFGFRDCHIWHGLNLKELRTPRNDTHKHPLKEDCYVRISQQTSRASAKARRDLKQTFSNDFQKVRECEKYRADDVITPFLEYDTFIHRAAQLIPPGRTIPECIFGPSANGIKNWPRNHVEVKKSLSWLAHKMTECQGQNSLFLLLATWVELSNATAMQRLGCKSLRSKPYFDWSQVFAYTNPGLLSSASASRTPAVASGKRASASTTPATPVITVPHFSPLRTSPPAARSPGDTPEMDAVSPKKTKSGRRIKRKTFVQIEFPPIKKSKPKLKHL